ncbi:FAD-dependent oxidoreductase [Pseudonocardia halophobica]|uniref:Pyridine nucleotide-disulfide oxidoreductase n=1 Tax=Pseudonocardia halophobica TaxID=29401 RepID=A0A9W6NXB9_9PSEU|nr:FAD-dependent oxidoreductase [Pseudonocardia halophobica]GLL12568.1 pyridine nucleotide-disulfide oxidoreductase [Pseudonocardia halophobica]
MSGPRTVVVVGAGLAGARAAEALRDGGFDGRITLIGAEPHRPYERPPLSKDYLQGRADRTSLDVRPAQWYLDNHVELQLDTLVTKIHRHAHELETAGGTRLPYDTLLLTTGARPRRLPVPGARLPGVQYLRTVDDSRQLRSALTPGSRVVIIGGGWIGLETAAAARAAGAEVTVLEHAARPLLSVLGPDLAGVFADLHTEHGVQLRCEVTVTAIRPAEGTPARAGGVVLADGTEIDADLVVVGIGVEPEVELARSCGLDVDDGILVDAHLVSSDRDILAAGDVADAFHPLLGRRIRVEHWANALHQPVVAARTILGEDAAYDRLPYFFTDQYDLGMEYTGWVDPEQDHDVVVRGDLARREFVAFWVRQGRLAAAMNVNVWDVTETLGGLIREGSPVDPAALADPAVPLDQVVRGRSASRSPGVTA